MYEAHPDKDGNAIDLGGKTPEDWQQGLGEGLELIRTALPTWFGELTHALERIVPVGYGERAHLSASYREAPGTVYMTLHPNRVTLAEAIIHETQHGKANAFSWTDALLHNGMSTWTESAVRPDLRPLWGVLLAVHAFVPVSALHHVMAETGHSLTEDDWFRRRRAQVIQGNANGIKTLKELADPTPLGREMLDSLYALHDFLVAAAPPPPEGIDEDALPPG
jgi:HEXXH motif-containing protein